MYLYRLRARLAALGLLALLAPAVAIAASTGPSPGDGQPGQSQQGVPAPNGGSNTGMPVIRPPAGIDPGINKALPDNGAPETFPTPVLPPPGSPGGNPNVVPK